ncbi:MAG: acetylglutamate kinase [Paenibacillaceae bacterium]
MGKQSVVIKCGGSTLAQLPDSFYVDMCELQLGGIIPIIVHGGGPAINETLERLNIESTFIHGLRQTSAEVLQVVEMVLGGQINKAIVRRILSFGATAVGLSGIDGRLIQAKPVANTDEVGFVGEVIGVNAELIQGIVDMGYIPVIAPLGIGVDGQSFNINADTAAGAIASHLGAERLVVVTDVPGIMKVIDGERIVLPTVTVADIEQMIASGDIYGGMIPKVRAAIDCIQGDVQEVIIVDGSVPEVLSKVLAGTPGLGTRIVRV